MNRKLFLALPLALSLVAYSPKSETNKSETNKTDTTVSSASSSSDIAQSTSTSQQENTSTEQSKTDPSNQGESSQSSTGATFNGSYYSVEGKYGPVIIVNKKHPLSSSYAPGEIPEAQAAFYQLKADMKAQGFPISDSYSGYRSYAYQSEIYQSYVNQEGQAAADTYSARPGYSEHQTGLAYDFIDINGQLLEEPVASQWLRDNAHHYGFIVRYLSGKESITGYMAETWHIRYIGPEAIDIYQSGLTLEEYFGVPGGDYE